MSKNPVVYFALKVAPSHFVVASFTANLGPVSPPMDHHGDLVKQVRDDFVSKDMVVRVRLKGMGVKVRAVLLGWSSDFEDDLDTSVDERWHVIATSEALPTDDVIELSGKFDPFAGSKS